MRLQYLINAFFFLFTTHKDFNTSTQKHIKHKKGVLCRFIVVNTPISYQCVLAISFCFLIAHACAHWHAEPLGAHPEYPYSDLPLLIAFFSCRFRASQSEFTRDAVLYRM